MKEAWKYLSGSVVVYVVMAACSAGSDPPPHQSPGAGTTGSSSAGMMAGSGRSGNNGGSGPNGGEPSMGGMMGMAGDTDPSGGAGDGPSDAGMMDALADAMMDPVPDADANPPTGPRLKRRYWVSADGTREPVREPVDPYNPEVEEFAWYDSQRDENCLFRMAADGVMRCLPASQETGLTFADSNCTVPVLLGYNRGCGLPVRYGHQLTDVEGCAWGHKVYAFDQPLGTTTYYEGGAGPECEELQTTAGDTLYAMGAEIPPTEFVGLTIEVEP